MFVQWREGLEEIPLHPEKALLLQRDWFAFLKGEIQTVGFRSWLSLLNPGWLGQAGGRRVKHP